MSNATKRQQIDKMLIQVNRITGLAFQLWESIDKESGQLEYRIFDDDITSGPVPRKTHPTYASRSLAQTLSTVETWLKIAGYARENS